MEYNGNLQRAALAYPGHASLSAAPRPAAVRSCALPQTGPSGHASPGPEDSLQRTPSPLAQWRRSLPSHWLPVPPPPPMAEPRWWSPSVQSAGGSRGSSPVGQADRGARPTRGLALSGDGWEGCEETPGLSSGGSSPSDSFDDEPVWAHRPQPNFPRHGREHGEDEPLPPRKRPLIRPARMAYDEPHPTPVAEGPKSASASPATVSLGPGEARLAAIAENE